MNTPTILKKILATKEQEVLARSKALPLAEIKAQALDQNPSELRGVIRLLLYLREMSASGRVLGSALYVPSDDGVLVPARMCVVSDSPWLLRCVGGSGVPSPRPRRVDVAEGWNLWQPDTAAPDAPWGGWTTRGGRRMGQGAEGVTARVGWR